MEFEAYDEATISQKLLPIFDDVFLQKLQEKESKTITLLSGHLAQIILQSSQKDLPALSRSLQSVISPAISKEIAENKDKMVDALYPIMGGMISKYVTQSIKEMMEHINEKIEDGLSFDRYKRKLKSKVTGVSETELLIEESNDAHISSLFVIHKESGLLIAEAHVEDQEIDDPHMVASMASAIKDFVNDWVQHHDEKRSSEVQIVSYGNETLYIESAGSVYIIAFLDAEPDHEQRADINAFFATLIKGYSAFFQNFNGDDSSKEIETISQKMHAFLNAQKGNKLTADRKSAKENTRKNPAKILLIILGMVAFGYLVYLGGRYYFSYRLEKRILEKTGQNVDVEYIADTIHIRGNITSMHDFYAIQDVVSKETAGDFVNELHMPLEELDRKVIRQQKSIEQLHHTLQHQNIRLDTLEKALAAKTAALQENTKRLNTLRLRYDALTEQLAQKKTQIPIKKIPND